VAALKIKFYTNAGLEIVGKHTDILCDPWFVPGAFDGSWWHWPPLKTKPEDLKDYTHLYISHIHPDHCDLKTLSRLKRKDVPVIILKRPESFLKKRIAACGFKNFVELEEGASFEIADGVRVTMFGAFAPNVFIEDAEIPNVIDSSIVVSDGTSVVFNANDNVPNKSGCRKILEAYPRIDAALLPYSGVGPYPSCYENLTLREKQIAAEEKKEKYLNRLIENVETLRPALTLPAAGQMILAGRQYHKNATLGIPSVEEAEALLLRHGFRACVLREGDVLDVRNGKVARAVSGDPDVSNRDPEALARFTYEWESVSEGPADSGPDLFELLRKAHEHMKLYQRKYGFVKDWTVGITLEEFPEHTYCFLFSKDSKLEKIRTAELLNSDKKFLQVKVRYAYLTAILNKRCHWNNAYHGCHVEYRRRPDEYLPEIQTLLSYFHL
jgi:UDP-MurNAc hydroxylase